MTYIQIGIIYCLLAFVTDFYILKTKVLKLRMFWLSYSIVLFFQFMFFGFSMILFTVSIWIWLGRRNIQKLPISGPPPRWWPKGHWYGTKK